MLNSRDVSLLRPDVAANCRTWLERCRAAGLNVLVTNTVRDRAYQSSPGSPLVEVRGVELFIRVKIL